MESDKARVELTNPSKLMFPDAGLTKRDVVDYYRRIAPTMLPHVRARPITMQRFPDGIGADGFYQKKAPDYFPDWIRRVEVDVAEGDGSGRQQQVVIEDVETLAYLANQACITPHVWLCRADRLDEPDRIIFDLDPPDDDFQVVRFAALALYDILSGVGIEPLVMTTGSRGLHVVIVLERGPGFDVTRDFARRLANRLADAHADRLTVAQRKEKREGRLFLDYLRNAHGQHGVAPYAIRPLPGAPVATPLDWSEVRRSDLDARSYRVDNIFRRLGQKEDPWGDVGDRAVALADAVRRLEER